MEPVDPRIAMRFILIASSFYALPGTCGWEECRRVQPHDGSGKQQSIDTIEHASVARKDRARVLHAGSSLDQRLHQIAKLRSNVHRNSKQYDRPQIRLLQPEQA